jgi:hypothetical protein
VRLTATGRGGRLRACAGVHLNCDPADGRGWRWLGVVTAVFLAIPAAGADPRFRLPLGMPAVVIAVRLRGWASGRSTTEWGLGRADQVRGPGRGGLRAGDDGCGLERFASSLRRDGHGRPRRQASSILLALALTVAIINAMNLRRRTRRAGGRTGPASPRRPSVFSPRWACSAHPRAATSCSTPGGHLRRAQSSCLPGIPAAQLPPRRGSAWATPGPCRSVSVLAAASAAAASARSRRAPTEPVASTPCSRRSCWVVAVVLVLTPGHARFGAHRQGRTRAGR